MATFLFSCADSSRNTAILQQAEVQMKSSPDSALALLDSLLMYSGRLSKGQEMRCRMHRLNALNKTGKIYTVADARPLISYFDRHGSANERMLAYYLLGRAHSVNNETPEALQCYHDAIECVDTTQADCDYYQLGLAHVQMAEIFMQQMLPEKELVSFRKAVHCAYLDGDTLTALQLSEFVMACYEELHQYDRVLMLSDSVHERYLQLGYPQQAAASLFMPIYVNTVVFHDTVASANLMYEYERHSNCFDSSGHIRQVYVLYYYVKGLYYLDRKEYGLAESMFRDLLHRADNANDKEAAYKGLMMLSEKKQETDSVAKYAKICYAMQDSLFMSRSAGAVLYMQSMYDYNRHKDAAVKEASISDRRKVVILILFFVLVFTLLIVYHVIKRIQKDKQEQIRNINTQYNLTLLRYRKMQAELAVMEKENEKNSLLVMNKQAEIDELRATLPNYHEEHEFFGIWSIDDDLSDNKIVSGFHFMASTGKVPSSQDWNDLKGLLMLYSPKFIELLMQSTSKLSFNEMGICMLVKLRFVPSELVVLLNMKPQAIVNVRSRLLTKLFGERGGARDFDTRIQNF